MFSKQFITISHSKDLFFRVHSEHRKRSLILSDAVAELTELWEAERLDSLILIKVVPGISVVVCEVCAIFNKYGGSNNKVVGEKL